MRLTFPSDAVVVVAGVPGAGKTTLIRRAVDPKAVGVVDTDDRREAGLRKAGWRGMLYARHYLRIAAAILVRRPALVMVPPSEWPPRTTLPPSRRAARIGLLLELDRAQQIPGMRGFPP